MKKLIKVTLLIFLLVTIFSFAGCNVIIVTDKDSSLEYVIQHNEIIVKAYKDIPTKKELYIPNEINGIPIKRLEKLAIANTEELQVINIGANILEIEPWALSNNRKLQAINVAEDNPNYCSVDGVLYTKDKKTLITYPNAKFGLTEKYNVAVAEFTIPEGVEEIAPHAFYKVYNLKYIYFPSTLKKVGDSAFCETRNLEEANFSEGLITIEKDAFLRSFGIKKITLPSTIKTIEEFAFFDVPDIQKFSIKAKKSSVTLGKKWEPSRDGKKITEWEDKKTKEKGKFVIEWING